MLLTARHCFARRIKYKKTTAVAVVLLYSGIRGILIGQAGEIVHAGFQCKSDAAALFKTHISLTGFDFRIITLVNPRQHLHSDL